MCVYVCIMCVCVCVYVEMVLLQEVDYDIRSKDVSGCVGVLLCV